MNSDKDYDLTIEAGKVERNYWKDIWKYRDLFQILVWRDYKVRYKQTLIGIGWSVLRPLFTMLIFTLVFGRIAELPSEGDAPYAIMVFAALLPWQFFANAVSESSNSLLSNQNLITKVYFPRLIIPISTVVTSIVDMLISMALLLILMLIYNYPPTWHFIFVPLFMVLVFILAIGTSVLLASFNIKYRDFRYVIPFIIQAGLFISPVGFSSEVVPEEWQLFYSFNPMVGIIDGFRWAVLQGQPDFDSYFLINAVIISLGLLILGIYFFRRMEREIADII